jgi:hypothetical protein
LTVATLFPAVDRRGGRIYAPANRWAGAAAADDLRQSPASSAHSL